MLFYSLKGQQCFCALRQASEPSSFAGAILAVRSEGEEEGQHRVRQRAVGEARRDERRTRT